MVIVANRNLFGGGPYSVAGQKVLRMVGCKTQPSMAQITVAPVHGGTRDQRGKYRKPIIPPYMPKHIVEPYHPGGNSACYAIQTAHLMGCDPIFLLGFTLQSASGYFFGRQNPVHKANSWYDADRACDWLRWYRATYPGRARLWPGWSGPIYDVLELADESQLRPRHQPDTQGVDAPASV